MVQFLLLVVYQKSKPYFFLSVEKIQNFSTFSAGKKNYTTIKKVFPLSPVVIGSLISKKILLLDNFLLNKLQTSTRKIIK